MLELIQEIVYEITGISDITMDTNFTKDLALNSLDMMNMIFAFENRFNIEIPFQEVWHLQQVKDLAGYLTTRNVC